MDVLVVQGANLSRLGRRDASKYGTVSAAQLDAMILAHAKTLGLSVEIFYTHHEGAAIQRIDEAASAGVRGLIMNPGGFAYAGYALRDCIRDQTFPYIEVHLSNSAGRGIGSKSVTSEQSRAYVCGFGADSYILALEGMHQILNGLQ